MTNRNQKTVKKKKEKQVRVSAKKEEMVKEEKGKNKMLDILSILVSGLALIISAVSLLSQYHYSELEYQYKIKPEIDMQGGMGVIVQKYEDGSGIVTPNVSECKIQVLQKNNLRTAYLIHDNYEVEEVELDNIENMLELELMEKIEFNKPSMVCNDIPYHYEFLLLEGIDDSYELFLIYLRSGKLGGEIAFDAVSGAEIIELEKSHIGEEDYEGEKELAKKYLEVLEECKKYMVR